MGKHGLAQESVIKMKPYKVTNCKTLRIRDNSDFDSKIIDRIPAGTIVNVICKRYGWAHIEQGYCRAEFLEKVDTNAQK